MTEACGYVIMACAVSIASSLMFILYTVWSILDIIRERT